MRFGLLKSFLPDRPIPVRIWQGPFRGARVFMNPRESLRKILGLYEHELNAWLEAALRRVDRVIDVGANDGYFTLGSAAAMRRHGIRGSVVALEPEAGHASTLLRSMARQPAGDIRIEVIQSFVGREVSPGVITLDSLTGAFCPSLPRTKTLIKIDVEGSELDVVAGGRSWLHPSNAFVVEVHAQPLLEQIKEIFSEHGVELTQIDQRPLPLLGRENRALENWWLVSTSAF